MFASCWLVPPLVPHERNGLILSLGAAIASAVDYKLVMLKDYESPAEEVGAFSACHTRSARRVLKALLANGGTYPLYALV